MKNKKLIIYGTGETADIVYEYFTFDSDYEVIAFTVDEEYKQADNHFNLPVINFEQLEEKFPPSEVEIFAASTYNKLNRVRTKMYRAAKAKGYKCATYISPKAFVWHNVTIGENVFIFENSVIQYKVKIGNNVMIWSGNHICHQTVIHDNVYLSSSCVVSGFCEIGEYSFLGANCTFNDYVKLGKDNLVASGALVIRNTEEGKLMLGVPAKPAAKSSYEAFNVTNEWLKI